MRFNANKDVKIRLTDEGREILKNTNAYIPKEDEDGWSKWVLWQVMNTFGKYIEIGIESPFEMEIEIIEEDSFRKENK